MVVGGSLVKYWTYRQICTQDNVAGGNLLAKVVAPAGCIMRPVACKMTASGTRAVGIWLADPDGNIIQLAACTAGAGANLTIPGIGTTPATSGNYPDCTSLMGREFWFQVTTAAQTETATLQLHMLVYNASSAPTVSWAGSGGTPNAAAATDNTITAAIM